MMAAAAVAETCSW